MIIYINLETYLPYGVVRGAMTSFTVYKEGREEGTIEVTNLGVSIQNHEEFRDLLEEIGSEFQMVAAEKEEENTKYIFKATLPTRQMIEVLTRLKLCLEDAGYKLGTY